MIFEWPFLHLLEVTEVYITFFTFNSICQIVSQIFQKIHTLWYILKKFLITHNSYDFFWLYLLVTIQTFFSYGLSFIFYLINWVRLSLKLIVWLFIIRKLM
jgi:hypothetical protein